jgi:tRNA (adenine37-N6)-methyltransferase
MQPIGIIESPYKEKFGIPRQAGLAKSARACLKIAHGYSGKSLRDSFDGLEEFSHIWVIFLFHELGQTAWKAKVRPPRLGGAKKTGVFSTRSPHRPNPIGISVVKLAKIEVTPKETLIYVESGDFLDGTPILDIKPYVPYADAYPRAKASWTSKKKESLKVSFSKQASDACKMIESGRNPKKLIRETIALDPRPAFQNQNADYAFRLDEFDVHWSVRGRKAKVESLRICEVQKPMLVDLAQTSFKIK